MFEIIGVSFADFMHMLVEAIFMSLFITATIFITAYIVSKID
jgi:hypothetical protein